MFAEIYNGQTGHYMDVEIVFMIFFMTCMLHYSAGREHFGFNVHPDKYIYIINSLVV